MHSPNARRRFALSLAAVLLSACGMVTDPGDIDFDLCPDIGGVAIDSTEVEVRLGEEVQLSAMALDRNGDPNMFCPAPTWSSSDAGALYVTGDGRITLVAPGTYWAYAKVDRYRDSIRVVASTAPIASLTIEPIPAGFLVGQTSRLAVGARDAAGNRLPVRRPAWQSSDTRVVAITADGAILARVPGTSTISAVVEGRTESMAIVTSRDAPAIRFTDIDAGAWHACALVGGGGIEPGTPYCWGSGFGVTARERARPVRIATDLRFEQVTVGMGHSCATTAAGAVWCWGGNGAGELGDGTRTPSSTPVRAATNVPLHGVVASGTMTCGLSADGQIHCWGAWSNVTRLRPAAVTTTARFTRLTAGDRAICGLATDGSVHCWGEFAYRQYREPTKVSGAITFRAIDMGSLALCGVDVDGAMWCWGTNTGPFWAGEGTRHEPVRVNGGENLVDVAAGGQFACATATDARRWCVGALVADGAGDGLTLMPVTRAPEHEFARVVGGGFVGCAIDVVGGAWCWGNNVEGGTGTGPEFDATRPLQLRVE